MVEGREDGLGEVLLVDGLDEGLSAGGEGDEGEAAEEGGEALDVVLALGAVDHGGMEEDAGSMGGEEGAFALEDATAVVVGPAGELAGAAEEDELGVGGAGGEDVGDVAGVGAGDDLGGVVEGSAEGLGVFDVGDAGGGLVGGPALGVADDGDDGGAAGAEGLGEGGAGAAVGADDVDGHGGSMAAGWEGRKAVVWEYHPKSVDGSVCPGHRAGQFRFRTGSC